MTMKAKGLLCYLLSLPDDWKLYKTELKKHFKDGKDGIYSAFDELVALGYVEQTEREKKQGKFDGYDYAVFDSPLRVYRSGSTAAEKPAPENPPLINNNIVYNKQIKNKRDDDSEKSSSAPFILILDFWLKEVHPGWAMDGLQGKHLKHIITKIKTTLTSSKKEVTDENIVTTFKYIINHLPEYFKNKDLATINSNYNEIIEKIKNPKHVAVDQNKAVYTPPPPSTDAKYTDPAYKMNYPDQQ